MKRIVAMVLFLALSLTMLSGTEAEGEKVVYLTFDDGPKAATPELLEVLEELDVPATFFLVGYAARAFPEYVRMIDERGYAIGCHTMDHSSSGIKETPEGLERIMHMFNEEISTCLGREFTTDLFRFPGGSSSYPGKCKTVLTSMGVAWFDWNAMTGDTHEDMNRNKVVSYVKKTSTPEEEVVILLAHDGKKMTREALPEIVDFYKEQGYTFRMLSTDMSEREYLERCSAHMGLPDLIGGN